MNSKKLNRLDITALALGSIIGWGSFTLPGSKFLNESGVINTAIALFLGGFAILFIIKAYETMMASHNEDGGEFSYTHNKLGKKHGFIVGWSLILAYTSMVPLNATAFVLVLKNIFGDAINFIYLYKIGGVAVYFSDIMIASLIIIIFTMINVRGLKTSSRVQNFMILLMVFNVILIFIFMLFNTESSIMYETYLKGYSFSFKEIAQVLAIVPFLFVGFDVIPQVTTDLGFDPKKAIRITVIAIFTGVLFYSMLNTVTGMVYTPSEALSKEWALGSAVQSKMGVVGFTLLIVSLMGAVSGGINGFMLGGSKLIASFSNYKFLPLKYSLQDKNNVNRNAIWFIASISLIAPWFGRNVIIYIVDMSSVLAALVYAYVSIIAFKESKGITKLITFLGLTVSISFMGLLLIPGSPAQLSIPSYIFLLIWGVLGFYYFKKQEKRAS